MAFDKGLFIFLDVKILIARSNFYTLINDYFVDPRMLTLMNDINNSKMILVEKWFLSSDTISDFIAFLTTTF